MKYISNKSITFSIILLFIGVSISSAISIDSKSKSVEDNVYIESVVEFEYTNITNPAICCEPGIMHWTKINPGETVYGTFRVWNCGENGSLLTWFVHSYPYWMEDVKFNPSNGKLTQGGSGIEVKFEFISPAIANWQFEGNIIVANFDIPQDFCEISTTLMTPRTTVEECKECNQVDDKVLIRLERQLNRLEIYSKIMLVFFKNYPEIEEISKELFQYIEIINEDFKNDVDTFTCDILCVYDSIITIIYIKFDIYRDYFIDNENHLIVVILDLYLDILNYLHELIWDTGYYLNCKWIPPWYIP